MGEIIFMAIIMVICGLGFAESFSWRVLARDNSGGAAFWPRIVMIALLLVASYGSSRFCVTGGATQKICLP